MELGLSDGIYVEIISGVTEEDNIKIWSQTEPEKRGYQERRKYDE